MIEKPKLLPERIFKRLINFDFRYAQKVEGSIYKIYNAKDIFENASEPHYIKENEMAFFHDGCCDHACCIQFKDCLFDF